MSENILVLPEGVVGRVDAGRLLREVEILDQFLEQTAVRQHDANVQLPRTSRLLDEILATNKLNALEPADRNRLLSFLTNVRSKAPMIHMSFSADPSPRFIQAIVTWLRREVHPLALVQIGLQPNIGAGCIVRTTNKQFDFSLKQYFKSQREVLIYKLRGASEPTKATPEKTEPQRITVQTAEESAHE